MIVVKQTILLVDDCVLDRETYKNYLLGVRDNQHNYRILEAETGSQGLLLCQQQLINAIVMDYLLPDMDGQEFINNLKTQFGQTNIPVIILTGRGNEQIAVQAMKSGAADYLVKKNTYISNLHLAIQNVLESTNLTRNTSKLKAEQPDRKQAQEVTHSDSARFQRLATNIPGAIYQYILHPDGSDEFAYVSPGCREIYELSPEELLQDFSQVWAMIHPLDVEAVNTANIRSTQTLEPFDIEFRLIPPSGRLKWVYAKSHPQRQENGDLIFDGLVMDISDRKQAEEKLIRTKALLESAQKLARVGSWEYDLSNEKIFWSEETFRIYGIDPTRGEPSLAELFLFVHPNDRALFEQSFLDIVTKGDNQEIEYQIVQRDGSVRYIEARGSALFDSQSQVTKIFGSVLDITSRKRQEAELQRAKEEAEIANEAKSNFLARMSHELRTPLNSILGFTEIMHDSTCNQPEHQEYIEIINKSGQHLLELVNDVLSLSKIEAGRIKLNEDTFNLHDLLKSLEDMLRLKAAAKQLNLTFEIATDLPQYTIADSSKLKQVLLNLLSNAIKFTEFGNVTLRASVICSQEETRQIYFEVIDTGLGIAPSEIGNLFSAFLQTETGRRDQEGTGLGLAISRKFVQLMGGDMALAYLTC